MKRRILSGHFAAVVLSAIALASTVSILPAAEPLTDVYADDFEHGMDRWEPRDAPGAPSSFEITEVKGPAGETTHALRALGTSKYEPEFRSPPNFALLKDAVVGDFEITAKVQSTNVDAGPHRDMCIIWGYQDPSHFYYVHFGGIATPDGNSCQIFIVNDAARTPITIKKATGTPWTEGWHNVKVTYNAETGAMEVFFDKMDEPFLTASDKTFAWGQVGLGTFDDNGNWDDFHLRGVKVEPQH